MRPVTRPRPFPRQVLLSTAVMTSALAATALTTPPANADPCSVQAGGGTFDCSRATPGGVGGGGATSGSTGGGGTTGEIPTLPGAGDGGLTVPDATAPEPPPVPTITLAQQARDSAQVPTPRVHTSPESRTYVRVQTALWVEGFTAVSTNPISVDGQTVQATATPKKVVWNLGETTLTCGGPGGRNDLSCSYTYQRSSHRQPGRAYRITATIYWGVTWTCQGPNCDAPSGTLDDIPMTSAPTPLVVDEIQTNTRP